MGKGIPQVSGFVGLLYLYCLSMGKFKSMGKIPPAGDARTAEKSLPRLRLRRASGDFSPPRGALRAPHGARFPQGGYLPLILNSPLLNIYKY